MATPTTTTVLRVVNVRWEVLAPLRRSLPNAWSPGDLLRPWGDLECLGTVVGILDGGERMLVAWSCVPWGRPP